MSEPETREERESSGPLLRIVSGDPTPDELAALLTVLAARSSGGDASGAVKKRSMWAARSRQVRPSLGPGRGAWRASTLPR